MPSLGHRIFDCDDQVASCPSSIEYQDVLIIAIMVDSIEDCCNRSVKYWRINTEPLKQLGPDPQIEPASDESRLTLAAEPCLKISSILDSGTDPVAAVPHQVKSQHNFVTLLFTHKNSNPLYMIFRYFASLRPYLEVINNCYGEEASQFGKSWVSACFETIPRRLKTRCDCAVDPLINQEKLHNRGL